MNGLAICAGVGGLELGLERVFDQYRCVAYLEGEAFAASNLVKKMEEGILAPAPIWSDLRTFDGSRWRGKVDLISAGFPCQPFSYAGSRKGTEDSRHLWPSLSRIIGEVGPSVIVLENVPGVLDAAGLGIFGDLSEMGYDLAWGIVRASEAGAPHRRARFFAVACHTHSDNYRRFIFRKPEKNGFRSLGEGSSIDQGSGPSGVRSKISYTRCEPREGETSRQFSTVKGISGLGGSREIGQVSHSNSTGSQRSMQRESYSKKRWQKSERHFTQSDRNLGEAEEWWKVEPGVGRVVDGVADWVDRLRACGNGVVPHQAELAIRILLNTLIERRSELDKK